MKKMKSSKCLLFCLLVLPNLLNGQNIFPQKLEGCNTEQFCLDCGEPKASYEIVSFEKMIEILNKKYNFKGGKRGIGFQVIVDSLGKGCVLSHTDATTNQFTKDLIQNLNNCQWIAAIDNKKPVTSSINIDFLVAHDRLSASIKRFDKDAFEENMSNPGKPEIYNKTYKYSNALLKTYEITVWQKENSNLPNDMSTTSVVDKQGILWYATYNGFAKFDGNLFYRLDKNSSPFDKKESIRTVAVDSFNNKWVFTEGVLYKYDNERWVKFDSTTIKTGSVFGITVSSNNEIILSTRNGVVINKEEKWELYDNKKFSQLPSNDVLYTYKDKKQRLWIGTFKGTIMIDENNKVTEFKNSDTPLNRICISGAAEDEEGNLYFSLYAFEKSKNRNRIEEGLAIFTNKGKWIHSNDTNSGLPANHINSILYDKFEKVLWIGTNEAGLVRFDLKDSWENYHNMNSKVPSSYIFDLSQDSKGNIYVSTFNGMMKISKK